MCLESLSKISSELHDLRARVASQARAVAASAADSANRIKWAEANTGHVRRQLNVAIAAIDKLTEMFHDLKTAPPSGRPVTSDLWRAIDELTNRMEYAETNIAALLEALTNAGIVAVGSPAVQQVPSDPSFFDNSLARPAPKRSQPPVNAALAGKSRIPTSATQTERPPVVPS